MSAITGMDDNTAQCVCDHIASACDQLAEAVSNRHEEQPPGYHDVCEALTTLYKLRAEIGFFGGKVVADLTAELGEYFTLMAIGLGAKP